MIKQIPMLYAGSMVRAILADLKWQTRRLKFTGKVGDIIWVRETWGYLGAQSSYPEDKHKVFVRYHADGLRREISVPTSDDVMNFSPKQNLVYPPGFDEMPDWQQMEKHNELLCDWWRRKKKIVAIHMPRWASRIELRVTAVRSEPLQSISEKDAIAEGINTYVFRPDDGYPLCDGYTHKANDGECALHSTAAKAFAELWQSINGAESWAANPTVQVIEFERVRS